MTALCYEAASGQRSDSLTLCSKDDLRTSFALAMSAMYQQEVPLYRTLINVTRHVNRAVAASEDFIMAERLDLERHGAIRLGTPFELRTVRRIFALIGLYPVDYYDLAVAGLPMHATAFRPIDSKALSKNPFRVFTTLLRPELLEDEARELALSLLSRRNIFTAELLHLIEVGEGQGGFTEEQGECFILEALKTFQWQSIAAATREEYLRLRDEHPIIADIACFNSAHINHLTPRVLDIVEAEKQMKAEGLNVKSKIEGPPPRQQPILLRQTSFLALQEEISFPTYDSDTLLEGSHKARFGEIEQRGAAVTAKGRVLYDALLQKALQESEGDSKFEAVLAGVFEAYPDGIEDLVLGGLIFCIFHCTVKASERRENSSNHVEKLSVLFAAGLVEAHPIVYEDFLPFSAAGIFRSNLHGSASSDGGSSFEPFPDRRGFEDALGCNMNDSERLYAEVQARSLAACASELGLEGIIVDTGAED